MHIFSKCADSRRVTEISAENHGSICDLYRSSYVAVVGKLVGGVVATALVLAGGYLWADIHDFVPGSLTLAPAPAPPVPFPTLDIPAVEPATAPVLPQLSATAPEPQSAYVSALVTELASDPLMLGERVGVVVADPLTGQVLGQASQNTPMVPASVQKLLTAAAGAEVLDENRTLKTKVVVGDGAQIYLVGEGDMMLAAGAGNPAALLGRSGLGDLAHGAAISLRDRNLTSVELFLDDSVFTGPSTGPWAMDLVTDGYAAPVAALAIDVGRQKEGFYAPRDLDPALVAAREFATALAAEGITVTGPSRRTYGEPGTAVSITDDRLVAQVESAPLGEIIDYAMKTSDNTITEIIGHTVARQVGQEASFAGATRAVLGVLRDLGLDTTGVSMVDNSGLGEKSLMPAKFVSDLLGVMTSADHPRQREAAIGLAVAGLDGTLADRFTEKNGRGIMRGKTGSLNNVTSLAGTVVTLDGRLLTFVVLADETPGGQAGPRKTMDLFVERLAECGCR